MKKLDLRRRDYIGLVIVFLLGYYCLQLNAQLKTIEINLAEPQISTSNPIEEGNNVNEVITLYFSDSNAEYLIGEERNIKELSPKKAIQALIEGPKNKNLSSTLPKEVEVVEVEIKEGIAYVYTHENVPEEIHGNYGSSTSTGNIIDSICATLILHEPFGIKKVKLEGGISELLYGPDEDALFDINMNSIKHSSTSSIETVRENLIPNVYNEESRIEVNFDLDSVGNKTSNTGDTFSILDEIPIPPENIKTISLREIVLNDSSMLAEYTNLECIEIEESAINDFTFLSQLKNLKYLRINWCTSDEFNYLENCASKETLIDLNLIYCKLNDNYVDTNAYENNISDISFLEGFTNLEELNLSGSNVSDINILSNFNNLKKLILVDGNHKIKTLEPIYGLKKLEWVQVSSSYNVTDEDIKRFGDPYSNGILELD